MPHSSWLAAISNNGSLAAAARNTVPTYEFEDRPGG
jgi:hypothetical protein